MSSVALVRLWVAAVTGALILSGCASDAGDGSDDDLTSNKVTTTFSPATDCKGTLPSESPLRLLISPTYVFTLQESALGRLGFDVNKGKIRATRIAAGIRYPLGTFGATEELRFSLAPADWARSTFELDFSALGTTTNPASVNNLYKLTVFRGNWLSDEWSSAVTCSKK